MLKALNPPPLLNFQNLFPARGLKQYQSPPPLQVKMGLFQNLFPARGLKLKIDDSWEPNLCFPFKTSSPQGD